MDTVRISEFKKIIKVNDSILFVNGKSTSSIVLGVVGVTVFYLILILNSQYFIANIIAIAFVIFFIQNVCIYNETSIDIEKLNFIWKKKVFNISIRTKTGELSENPYFLINQETISDSGNVFVLNMLYKNMRLRVFDMDNEKGLKKVLSFLSSNDISYEDHI